MYTKEFDYYLPTELIAQFPVEPRDSSRLMVVEREQQTIEHRRFFDIVEYVKKGDLLVWNNTKVFKARLYGDILLDTASDDVDDIKEERLHPTGKILNSSKVEIFLVRPMENKFVWKVLAKPGRRLRLGMKVRFAPDFEAEVITKEKDGTILMQFGDEDMVVREKANKYGEVPVPPYIQITPLEGGSRGVLAEKKLGNNKEIKKLYERYQTVYAKREGSVAAPTAGFHFTAELIEKLEKKGVQFAEVTLHVGLGTFLPVKTERIEDHVMHSEWAELTAKNADLINAAKAEGRRVVAVGTTSVRVLEGVAVAWKTTDYGPQTTVANGSAVDRSPSAVVQPFDGDLNIFITPGFQFQIVDALITNFHLPKSTLLMLV